MINIKTNPFSLGAFLLFWGLFGGVSAAGAASDVSVRVNIGEQLKQAVLFSSQQADIYGETRLGWVKVGTQNPQQPLVVKGRGKYIKLNLNLKEPILRVKIKPTHPQNLIALGQRWYRGEMLVKPVGSRVRVVNRLPLEKYLYSVIPSEMPHNWPIESLKSQAVAARTYALSHLGSFEKYGYDLKATVSSQVYQGLRAETASSHRAVQHTAGEIMTYQGKPIHAYFHSTSGGRTEAGGELWAKFPYLKSVKDYDYDSPKYTWQKAFNQSQLRSRLAKKGLYPGRILRVEVSSRTTSGRAKTLQVLGQKRSVKVKATTMRTALGLNSTFFNIGNIAASGKLLQDFSPKSRPTSFQFAGRGWGHGLGMSQWGARQMALDGHGYRDILHHYYQKVKIKKINSNKYRLVSDL